MTPEERKVWRERASQVLADINYNPESRREVLEVALYNSYRDGQKSPEARAHIEIEQHRDRSVERTAGEIELNQSLYPKRLLGRLGRETKATKFTQTTDASAWAKAFVDRFGGIDEQIDEALMLGWFANAIEKGRGAGYREGMESCGLTCKCASYEREHGHLDVCELYESTMRWGRRRKVEGMEEAAKVAASHHGNWAGNQIAAAIRERIK